MYARWNLYPKIVSSLPVSWVVGYHPKSRLQFASSLGTKTAKAARATNEQLCQPPQHRIRGEILRCWMAFLVPGLGVAWIG